ncbi:MAG: 30S ribosomal protein S20 [Candidatus Paceibacterota bacterium]|jgi:small subunit ribosomal protein S20
MPITKSAKKALRQNVSRRKQNLKRKETYKQVVKEVRKLAKNKQKTEAQALLSKAFQALDKAAKTNVIKKNKASRLKSRISKILGK